MERTLAHPVTYYFPGLVFRFTMADPPGTEEDVPHMPAEIWELVLEHFRPHEEYPAAAVCATFYSILQRKRELRGEKRWVTPILVLCNTVARLEWGRENGIPRLSKTQCMQIFSAMCTNVI